jgi:hypothetical protein
LLLARLGLRAGEVVALELEDLSMRQGLGGTLRVPAGLLRRFVAFLDGEQQEVITRESARHERDPGAPPMTASVPATLQRFFPDRLLRQRQASPHTIAIT